MPDAPAIYRPRKPQESAYYQCIEDHFETLEQVYDDIKHNGWPEPAIYPMNLEGDTPADYDDLNNNIDREFGRLDGLMNNAGWLGASTPIEIYDIELWYKVMQGRPRRTGGVRGDGHAPDRAASRGGESCV